MRISTVVRKVSLLQNNRCKRFYASAPRSPRDPQKGSVDQKRYFSPSGISMLQSDFANFVEDFEFDSLMKVILFVVFQPLFRSSSQPGLLKPDFSRKNHKIITASQHSTVPTYI